MYCKQKTKLCQSKESSKSNLYSKCCQVQATLRSNQAYVDSEKIETFLSFFLHSFILLETVEYGTYEKAIAWMKLR